MLQSFASTARIITATTPHAAAITGLDENKMKGFHRFLLYRSLTMAGTLVAATIIVVVVVYQGLGCSRIDAIIAEIR